MRRYLAIVGLSASLIAVVAAALASAAPQPNTKYTGRSSQHQKVSLRTTADGVAVRGFTIVREFVCGEDDSARGTFRQSSGLMKVRSDGRFFGQDNVQSTGSIKKGVFTIRGRFGPGGNAARGTYRERVRLQNGTRCDTGLLRFRVTAQD